MLPRTNHRGLVASFIAAAALAVGLTPAQAQAPSGQPITIGFGMALTGHIASAVTFLLIAGAAGVGLLYAAAIFWKDEPGDKPDGESK